MNINFVSDNKGYAIHNNASSGVSEKNVPKPTTVTFDGKTYSPGQPIVQFSFYLTTDPKLGYVEKGMLSLDSEKDKERIEFVRNYPDNKRAYREVKNLPQVTYGNGGIVTGAGAVPQQTPSQAVLNQSLIEKTVRYMNLKQKLFNKNGEMKKDVEEAESNEFNELSKELNLQ